MIESVLGVVLACFVMVVFFLVMVAGPLLLALFVLDLIFGRCDCHDCVDTDDSEL